MTTILVATLLSQEVPVQQASARMQQQETATSPLICSNLKALAVCTQALQSRLDLNPLRGVTVPSMCQVTRSPEPESLSRNTTMTAMPHLLEEPELLAMARIGT
jgi:hypothetical protein